MWDAAEAYTYLVANDLSGCDDPTKTWGTAIRWWFDIETGVLCHGEWRGQTVKHPQFHKPKEIYVKVTVFATIFKGQEGRLQDVIATAVEGMDAVFEGATCEQAER